MKSAASPRGTATLLSREPYWKVSPPVPAQFVPPIAPPSSLQATSVPVWALRMYRIGSKVRPPEAREYVPHVVPTQSEAHMLKNCVAPHVVNHRTSSPDGPAPPPHVVGVAA